MKKNKYYWLCSYKLEVGSVIKPGNWGRMVKMYIPQNNHHQAVTVAREFIFESIRFKYFPDKPAD